MYDFAKYIAMFNLSLIGLMNANGELIIPVKCTDIARPESNILLLTYNNKDGFKDKGHLTLGGKTIGFDWEDLNK